jgi:hypothetical protein
MKRSNIISILAVALIVLAIFGSGCLGSKEPTPPIVNPQNMNSVRMATREEHLIALIDVSVYNAPNQRADQENITADLSGNDINIIVSTIESGSSEKNKIYVNFGHKDRFKDGQRYNINIFVNGNKDSKFSFELENGTPYLYEPAGIDKITVDIDGKNVVVKTNINIGGFESSVDKENITVSEKFENENNYEIYIPRKTQIYPMETAFHTIMNTGQEEIIIGQTNELKKGTYYVNVNGKSASFKIK